MKIKNKKENKINNTYQPIAIIHQTNERKEQKRTKFQKVNLLLLLFFF